MSEIVPDAMVSLSGYRLDRNDRNGRVGGGVMLYVKVGIDLRILAKSSLDDVEFLICELKVKSSKILISVVYNNSYSNNLDAFINELANYSSNYSDVIVVGDFNLNLLNPEI